MPPARALIDAAALSRSRPTSTRELVLREPPLVCSLAATQPDERGGAGSVLINAAHVLGRADRKGDSRRASCRPRPLDAPDWRYLAYHLGGEVVAETIVGGRLD
jgi:hypothetical protein